MKIQLRFFASVREALGVSQELLELPEQVKTVGDVRALLHARGGVWAQALGEGRPLRIAYQQVVTDESRLLTEAEGIAELAFFPPVTGG